MADKAEFPLSIILRTVDRYTAGLKQANEQIDKTFKPYRAFGKELGKFSENLGLPKLRSALGSVGTELKNLTVQAAAFGAVVAGVGVHVIKGWIDDFDKLGDTADRLGVTAQALAEFRHAGKMSGVEVGEMDSALGSFNVNLGKAHAGTGKLASFLGRVSPKLLAQVKAAKSSEEAFGLLADATTMLSKHEDKAALAQAAFGGSGEALLPLLAKGSAGIEELRARYAKVAPNMGKAAAAAGQVDDAFNTLNAGWEGTKATLLMHLSPAIKDVATQLSTWLSNPETQQKIADWAKDFGEKLPGRIKALVDAIKEIGAAIKPVWDMIGGAKGALELFAAVKLAPLAASLASVAASLFRVGQGINAATGTGGAAAGALGGGGGGGGTIGGAAGVLGFAGLTAAAAANVVQGKAQLKDLIRSNILPSRTFGSFIPQMQAMGRGPALAPPTPIVPPFLPGQGPAQQASIKVEFTNAPRGTRVTSGPTDTADVDLDVGYQLGMMP